MDNLQFKKVGLFLRTVNAFRIATLFTILYQKLEFTDFAHKVLALILPLPAHITVTENFSILCKYKCQGNKLQNMNIPYHCIHRQHKQQSTISVQNEMEQQSQGNGW